MQCTFIKSNIIIVTAVILNTAINTGFNLRSMLIMSFDTNNFYINNHRRSL